LIPERSLIRPSLLDTIRVIQILETLFRLTETSDKSVPAVSEIVDIVELLDLYNSEPCILRDHILPIARDFVFMPLTVLG
jgi:hypothetical protein